MFFSSKANKFDYYSKRVLSKNSTKGVLTKDMVNSSSNKLNLNTQMDLSGITKSSNFGIITEVRDEVVFVMGLSNAGMSERIEVLDVPGLYGMVQSLGGGESSKVQISILGKAWEVEVGMWVERKDSLMTMPASFNMIGTILSSVGKIEDYMYYSLVMKYIYFDTYANADVNFNLFNVYSGNQSEELVIENTAPSIMRRTPVKESLKTGVKLLDSMIPIGCGQRELIIGDKKIGKTCVATDIIINQKNSDVSTFCIYVAIGIKKSSVAHLASFFCWKGCFLYTSIVSATAADSSTLQFLAPYSGCSLGEYFMYKGYRVVVIYDDLSKHAVAYRQMSLLLRRPPGREGYPGDVFYLHSRLLERSAKLNNNFSQGAIYSIWASEGVKVPSVLNAGGSLTAFPVIETIQGDVSAYIPTNVISITDGQIYLELELFNRGIRPALSPGLSVSRIGSAVQNKIMKSLAGSLKLELAVFRELENFARLGFVLDDITTAILDKGGKLMKLLTQPYSQPLFLSSQLLLLYGGLKGYFRDLKVDKVVHFEECFLNFFQKSAFFIPLISLISSGVHKTLHSVFVNSLLNSFKLFYLEELN